MEEKNIFFKVDSKIEKNSDERHRFCCTPRKSFG